MELISHKYPVGADRRPVRAAQGNLNEVKDIADKARQ
jgi:hypothetical protein